MCTTCGCSAPEAATHDHAHAHDHPHAHAHPHEHPHAHPHEHPHTHPHDHAHAHDHPHTHAPPHPAAPGTTLRIERDLLEKNARLAERNRGWLAARRVLALNLVSAPGAGKTALLERTIRDLGRELPLHVIEGDQATARDAERIRAAGCPAVQINTGAGCHLDAAMVARALDELDPAPGSVVFIENVGNLVCPALFDLGERSKVVVAAVTEGDDKPLKYPHMYRAGDVAVLNKIDLLPHVVFDPAQWLAHAREVNPRLVSFQLSATRGDGLAPFHDWLRAQAAALAPRHLPHAASPTS